MQLVQSENDIFTNYLRNEFDELNSVYTQLVEAGTLTQDIMDEIFGYMMFMFMNGYQGCAYLLGETSRVTPSNSEILDAFQNGASGATVQEAVMKYAGENFENAMSSIETVIRTEGHRMYVSGQITYAKSQSDEGMRVTKIWDTTMDGNERETHRRLNGTEIGIDEYFETVNGRAKMPGQFGVGEEDCNCRCILTFNRY